MPTKPILKAIFIPCITGAVILVIVLQFLEPCKKLEALISALFGICCLTNCINAVFFKELYLKGDIYKGNMVIFLGYLTGLAAVLLLSLTLLYLGIFPGFFSKFSNIK
jgi:hypothetical protein